MKSTRIPGSDIDTATRSTVHAYSASVVLAATLYAAAAGSVEPMFQFEIFGMPDQGRMVANDLNNENEIVGRVDYFGSGSLKPTGWLRDAAGITLIDVPGSGPLNGTEAWGINDAAQIVGTFVTEDVDQVGHGFLLDDGVFTTLDAPGATYTASHTINEAGVIGGRAFVTPEVEIGSGFILDDGNYSFFLPPDAVGNFGIAFYGLNDQGNVVGEVFTISGIRAFAIIDGIYTPFSVPGSVSTVAFDINEYNQIVGTFSADQTSHGFLMDATGLYQIDSPEADVGGTFVNGVNDWGFLAGAIDTPGFPSAQALFATPCFSPSMECRRARRIGESLIDLPAPDADVDGVVDYADNCLEVSNADQRDTDLDGIGNACDADFNEDCIVNTTDLGRMRQMFFTTDEDVDLNGDGVVNFVDLSVLKDSFFAPPGPSGSPSLCGRG